MTVNSKVLALKYRPKNFRDVVGQDVAVQTIYNAVKAKKVPNAYLFTGIRGTGKTTLARLVAKSLNCINGSENICEKKYCDNCEAISNSNHLDVLEMDAASKTGVDDVRDLIEFSRYPPNSAKYKIFIIDEVHMLSKQAFNALLKTLEEPPDYLKFIFCTTEIKKIPVTVISRTQRFDLSRVKSEKLFNYIKDIKDKENGKATDEAIKLIVKISEGSVRDALSLLDRGLMSNFEGDELDLKTAQKIFGYFDKSYLIDLFHHLFDGNEEEVIKLYREIYNNGIEPKNFLNDFLEILYYVKNVTYLKIDGTNFSLNNEEFEKIKEISNKITSDTSLLFWQFTVQTMSELEIVSNQNLSIEMFLIRLLYLKKIVNKKEKINLKKNELIEKNIDTEDVNLKFQESKINEIPEEFNFKNKTISQIKNISQKQFDEEKKEAKIAKAIISINDFDELIKVCNNKKEVRLKYELENNVNLVGFEDTKIEISFNDNLDKNFFKNLSSKLFEWTNKRWIIAFSKREGKPTKKHKEKLSKELIYEEAKETEVYKKVKETFLDAELIDIKERKDK